MSYLSSAHSGRAPGAMRPVPHRLPAHDFDSQSTSLVHLCKPCVVCITKYFLKTVRCLCACPAGPSTCQLQHSCIVRQQATTLDQKRTAWAVGSCRAECVGQVAPLRGSTRCRKFRGWSVRHHCWSSQATCCQNETRAVSITMSYRQTQLKCLIEWMKSSCSICTRAPPRWPRG